MTIMNVTRSRVAVVSNIGQLLTIGGGNGIKNLSSRNMYRRDKRIELCLESHKEGFEVGCFPIEEQ